ncbi:hypothetical protein MLD38_035500 [Melastoma candidum]|uniref:Uncharacterized protein n=1 Tax=Melastoma candidum TaxID=119954 RepID=A0ACB9LHZ9_9MYRT|nr:hypothetical protein MLD38_035500 [Melastoma candidum]
MCVNIAKEVALEPLEEIRNSKLRDKGEFSWSSLRYFCSSTTITSLSNESNLSRSSWSNKPHMSKAVGWEAIQQVRRQDRSLGLRHFNLLKKLGCGDIGPNYLAKLIGNNCLFAIKVMDNEFLAKRKKALRSQTEREILRILDHPFLPALFTIHFSGKLGDGVLSWWRSSSLCSFLRPQGKGSRNLAQKSTFKSLPQLVAEPTNARSVGIHEYLAPEIIKSEGHVTAMDWWTLGIFLCVLLHGRTPFKGARNEETQANMALESLHYPKSWMASPQALDLIWRLLVKDPASGLGTEKCAAEMKLHPFFEGLNRALIPGAVPPALLGGCY